LVELVSMAAEQSTVGTLYEVLRDCLRSDEPVALATVVATKEATGLGAKLLVRPQGESMGSLGSPELDASTVRDAHGALALGQNSLVRYGPRGEIGQEAVTVFVEAFCTQPRMIILGAVDFSAALASMAKLLGYRVVVCDARPVFATARRFPGADEVVAEWPDRYLHRLTPKLGPRDAVCVLTHDTKFDVPGLVAALETDVGYIGAMGSRRTTERRNDRLREAGVTDDQLAGIRAPIGLDLGARTPEETAVSILAEIIATQTGANSAMSLSEGSGPIHRDGRTA
jgi:xanthine dehydrogenase accessory factor